MVKKKSRSYVGHFGSNNVKNQDSLMPGQLLALPPDLPLPDSSKATLEDVSDMVRSHIEYKSGKVSGTTPRKRDRPKFDDLTEYDVTEAEELALWDVEVKRLHAAVQKMRANRLAFASETLFPEPDTATAYKRLARIADQVLFNMHICRHDNAILLQQHAERYTTQWEYRNSHKILEDRLEQISIQRHKKLTGEGADEEGDEDDEDDEDDDEDDGFTDNKTALGTREFLVRYCAFVDYVTATAARLAVSAADHEAWQSRALCGLAKYSAKLKMLARDSQEYASRSLEYGRRFTAERKVLEALGATSVDIEDADYDDGPMFRGMDHRGAGGGGNNAGGGGGGGGGGLGVAESRFAHFNHPIYEPRRQRELEAFLETSKVGGDSYFADMSLIDRWTSSTLLFMLQALKPAPKMGLAADTLDVCSVVYRGGTLDSPLSIFVHQDRDGDLSGSSRSHFVKHSYQGFKLFRDAVEELRERSKKAALAKAAADEKKTSSEKVVVKEKQKESSSSSSSASLRRPFFASSPSGRADSIEEGGGLGGGSGGAPPAAKAFERPSGTRVTAHLQIADDGEDETIKPVEMPLETLGQIIAVMVPLMCTQPNVVSELQTSLQTLGEMLPIDIEEDFRPRAPEYTAVASLHTLTFDSQSSSCLPGADFRSLSRSLVAQTHRHAALGARNPTATNVWENASAEQRMQRLREVRRRQERLAKEATEWVVEERTVRVRCEKYVYTVMAVCSVLVVGGLMIGVFLGTAEKGSIALQGVDPFGITTYAWVVAGFIMLVAKSIRVNEWPWRDFLLQRVTCHSLSELQAVTGVDAQDLLVYLLTTEAENVLVAKGPYNKTFSRRGGEGFAIDVKPEIRTLIAAGLLFVKVSMHNQGNALVCLDLRAGGNSTGAVGSNQSGDARTAVRQTDMAREGDILCRYLPRSGDRVQDLEISQRNVHIRWRKVLGIYHSYERKIR